MDSLSIRFRTGFTGTVTGVPTNSGLQSQLDQVYGPNLAGVDYQIYCPDTGLLIAANSYALVSLVNGDLVNPFNEPIEGDDALATIIFLQFRHSINSLSERVTFQFGGPDSEWAGPFAKAGGQEAECWWVPGSGFSMDWPGIGLAVGDETGTGTDRGVTGGTVPPLTDGWQLKITNNDPVQDAIVFLNLAGKRVN